MAAWARSLILIAVGLVVWLASPPAFAAAPLCDDRGAIMLAPAPILDAPTASVDVGEPFDCMDQHAFDASYDKGSSSDDPAPAPRHLQAILTPAAHVLRPDVLAVSFGYEAPSIRPGVRHRLERPPRNG